LSDPAVWTQRLLKDTYGIRVSIPAVTGPQEAVITKVGTDLRSIAKLTAVEVPVVWFLLPNSFGPGPGWGPATYQASMAAGFEGGVPPVGAPCIVIFVGNGVGQSHVVSFPTAPA
jgi:hypothetical protein